MFCLLLLLHCHSIFFFFFWNSFLITLKLLCVFISLLLCHTRAQLLSETEAMPFHHTQESQGSQGNLFFEAAKINHFAICDHLRLICDVLTDNLEQWLKSVINYFLLRQLRDIPTGNVRLWFDWWNSISNNKMYLSHIFHMCKNKA